MKRQTTIIVVPGRDGYGEANEHEVMGVPASVADRVSRIIKSQDVAFISFTVPAAWDYKEGEDVYASTRHLWLRPQDILEIREGRWIEVTND